MTVDQDFIHRQRLKLLDYVLADEIHGSVADIKEQLLGFYSAYNMLVANLGTCAVYRVRQINPGDRHANPQDVWCPPANVITEVGRANDVGQPVFYGSLDPATAVTEIGIEPGEEYSLAAYWLSPLDDYNMSSVVIKKARTRPGNGDEFSRFGVELSKFMVKEFTRNVPDGDESQYKRSCAIASLLFDLPGKDSILYPSVKDSDSVNIAMKVDSANSRLRLTQIVTCKMLGVGEHTVSEVRSPNHDGLLIHDTVSYPLPSPIRLRNGGPKFSNSFSYDKITSSQDIIQHFMAKKAAKQ